jgi:hypothetical protein
MPRRPASAASRPARSAPPAAPATRQRPAHGPSRRSRSPSGRRPPQQVLPPGEDNNRTRPPPCMRWRGPCSTCRSRRAGCLAAPAPAGRPPGPATRVRSRFPGSFHVPRVSPKAVSVSDVKVFLLLSSPAAQAPAVNNREFFRYPQNDGGYPRTRELIHRLVHNMSTGHRLHFGLDAGGRTPTP